jgi:glutamate-5-semialdehyde dehydrogenase
MAKHEIISEEAQSEHIKAQIAAAKAMSTNMAILSEAQKNFALELIERELLESISYICAANEKDLQEAKAAEISSAMLDRLILNPSRIMAMAKGIRNIINIKDPIGTVLDGWRHPKGMQITKVSVPLGVIGIIYEARPNVTTDAIALAIKSGNGLVLRGSKQAWNTNTAIMEVAYRALKQTEIPLEAIQYLRDKSRESCKALLRASGEVDLVIPRGCEELNKFVSSNSLIPVLGAGGGVCHAYVDKYADFQKALDICINAKTSRPSVCNAIETILIHDDVKEAFVPVLVEELSKKDVEIIGDQEMHALFPFVKLATEEDWSAEYLDLKVSIKIVHSLKEAVEHINKYSTGHSETIITEQIQEAEVFKRMVNSACVYVNVSTRFTDGEEFGYGAEMGISTQKLHARGPIGLKELCTYKFIIEGDGQIR